MEYGVTLKKGFTLAEVLITLAIIGVVAALTIPTVIRNYQLRQTVTAVKKAYSQLESAFKMGIVENGPIESANLQNNTQFTGTYFKPYLKVLKDCGVDIAKNCYNVTIKNTANNANFTTSESTNLYHLISADGMVMSFNGENGCNRNESKAGITDKMLSNICGYVYVDINGATKPNRAGVDVFAFWVTKYGVVPFGGPNDRWSSSTYCNRTSAASGNGEGCAAWVIAKENMDYLQKDVSW